MEDSPNFFQITLYPPPNLLKLKCPPKKGGPPLWKFLAASLNHELIGILIVNIFQYVRQLFIQFMRHIKSMYRTEC